MPLAGVVCASDNRIEVRAVIFVYVAAEPDNLVYRNSAGVVIDAIRCCKLALDQGLEGSLIAPSAYFMKSPPVQYSDDEARRLLEVFINAGEAAPPVSMGEASDS